MMDFTSALDTKVEDFEEPKLQPEGTYIWAVTKAPESRVVGKNDEWDMLTFNVKCISAEDDVDPDDLQEFGSVANNPNRVSYIFPKDPDEKNSWDRTMAQLKRFLGSTLQIDGFDNMTLKEALAASPNHQFLGVLKHKPRKDDPNIINAEITSTAPLG